MNLPLMRHIDAILVGLVIILLGGLAVSRWQLPNSAYLVVVILGMIAGYIDYFITSHYF